MHPIRPNRTKPRWIIPLSNEGFFHGSIAFGNMTQKEMMIWLSPIRVVHFAVSERGYYSFKYFAHKTYVQEKLSVMEGDAGNIADIINSILCVEHDEQGDYYDHLCNLGEK